MHKDIDDERNTATKGEGLDVNFGVSIKTGAEEYQGEVDLRELTESINTLVKDNISKQIHEQLDKKLDERLPQQDE